MEVVTPSPESRVIPSAKERLALVTTNWLEDRDKMRFDNDLESVAWLLSIEMNEVDEALVTREKDPYSFHDLKGEIADIIIFTLTLLSQLEAPIQEILEAIPESVTGTVTAHDLRNLSDQITVEARENNDSLEEKVIEFLRAAFAFSYVMGYDPTDDSVEKVAFNTIRYPAGRFKFTLIERIAERITEIQVMPEEIKSLARKYIHYSFKKVKLEGRAETLRLHLKTMFYELPFEPIPAKKAKQKVWYRRYPSRIYQQVQAFASIITGLGTH